MGFRVQMLGFLDFGVRIWFLDFGVWSLGFGVWTSGFGVWGLEVGFEGLGRGSGS
jgi:hypothetical protein